MEDIDLKHLRSLLAEVKSDIFFIMPVFKDSLGLGAVLNNADSFLKGAAGIENRLQTILSTYDEYASLILETRSEFTEAQRQARSHILLRVQEILHLNEVNAGIGNNQSYAIAFDRLNHRLDAAKNGRDIPLNLYLNKDYKIVLKLE
jgi:hypothetical protein